MAQSVDVYVLLDILLLILVALFIPIGFWRGAYREAFVTLGILFGAALALFWGDTWGTELAALTRLHESGGAFMVAMLCLIGSTFLIGYSAGAAVPVPAPGWIARSLGAMIAGANGALLLSFALRDIRIYLLTGEETDFLDNAVIAPFLSQGAGWILLIAAAVFVPVVLVVAMFGPDTEIDEYYETGEYDAYDEDIETYSAPQASRHGSASRTGGRVVTPVEETLPIPAVAHDQPHGASNQSHQRHETTDERPMVFGYRPEPRSETSPSSPDRESQQAITEEGSSPAPESEPTQSSNTPATASNPTANGNEKPDPVATPEPVTGDSTEKDGGQEVADEPAQRKPVVPGTCPHCRADIGDAEGYCPSCGRVI